MSKLDHTLAATWTRTSDRDNKNITGCVVGQPVFCIHHANTTGVDFCFVRATAGAKGARSEGSHYCIGTSTGASDSIGGANAYILIPTATSITVQIDWYDGDDTIYVYKT